jgi:3-hydroxy-9,10-secoandrosta-1,3,5(10)-triene-9,17-dione monooxygenase
MTTKSETLAPTEADLIQWAHDLGPSLAARRVATAAARRISRETIDEIVASGILRASLPTRFGGYELPFGTHTSVAMELGRYCPATAWVAGILSSHNWWLGKYHTAAQDEIWQHGPDVLVAAAFACKRGGTKPAGDDFITDGEWLYCSGIGNCEWAIVVGPLLGNDGNEQCMALLHRSEYQVQDVWHAPGLSGTGSNNVIVDNVRLPAHRVIRVAEMNARVAPGAAYNDSSTYRLPTLGVFAYSVAAPVLGMAQGGLDAFVASMRDRFQLTTGTKIAGTIPTKLRVSASSAEIDAARALYFDGIQNLRNAADSNRDLTPAELARVQRNCAFIAKSSKQAMARLVEALGAGGMDKHHPVHLAHADVLGGSAHGALAWDTAMPNYGEQLFQA